MIPDDLIEAVAREACRQMGLDPDEMVWPRWFGVMRWELFTNDARKAIAFARAVKIHDREGE